MKELESLKLERHVLAGIVKYPDSLAEFDTILSDKEFVSKTHQILFSIVKGLIEKQVKFDRVLLAQKLKDFGVTSYEEVSIFDYCDNLFDNPIRKDALYNSVKELAELRIKRDIVRAAKEVEKHVLTSKDRSLQQVIQDCDSIYNSRVSSFISGDWKPNNIYGSLESVIEEIGNNPPDPSQFKFGPFERINQQYGSLLRPHNITVIGARTGVAKTSLGLFYLTNICDKYDSPILHLDYGEMSDLELQMRAVCMLSQGTVPYYLIESGKWRNNKETERIVRSIWPRVKKMRYYYEQVGGMTSKEICNLIRKYQYHVIGRENEMIVHYDYFKPMPGDNPNTPDWRVVGQFAQDLKSLIVNEIKTSIWASIQLNRKGITNNKKADEVDDSEGAFSISDEVVRYSSHAFTIRNKTMDEVAIEGNRFGNLKMIKQKARHLGEDYGRALTPVKISKGKFQNNYINLLSNSFHFEEKGDLVDIVDVLREKVDLADPKVPDEDLP